MHYPSSKSFALHKYLRKLTATIVVCVCVSVRLMCIAVFSANICLQEAIARIFGRSRSQFEVYKF